MTSLVVEMELMSALEASQIIANIAAVSEGASQSSQIPRMPLPPPLPVPPPPVLNLPAYRRTLSLCSDGQVWFCSNLNIDVHRAAHMEATAVKKREGRSNSKGRGSQTVCSGCPPCHCPAIQTLWRRLNVNGMSSAQIYVKTPGVWTGAHEEKFEVSLFHKPFICLAYVFLSDSALSM